MPRSVCLLSVLAVLASASVGCKTEDPPALFLDLAYQLRCIDCSPRVADGPIRNLSIVDGEMNSSLSCYSSPSGGTNLLYLELENEEFGLKLTQVRLGANPGDRCEVEIKEGAGNSYRGGCKPVGSDDGAPCEVELTKEGDAIVGTIQCTRVAHTLTPTYTRHFVAPNSEDPVEITIVGCTGF